MSSFEFYGPGTYASCQYDAEEFFVVLTDTTGDYPMLQRARSAFEALHDDLFAYASGETKALANEIAQIVQGLKLNLVSPEKRYLIFCMIAQELTAVFQESEANETDIKFRWG